MALTEGAKQLIWLRRFIWELGIDQSQLTSLCSNNLGAITLSQDVTYHAHTKHINVTYCFICEKVASHKAVLTYIPTKDNIVDILTKGLKLHQHRYLMGKLGFGVRNFSLRGSPALPPSPSTEAIETLKRKDFSKIEIEKLLQAVININPYMVPWRQVMTYWKAVSQELCDNDTCLDHTHEVLKNKVMQLLAWVEVWILLLLLYFLANLNEGG